MEYDPDDFTAFQQLYESVSKLPELTSDHDCAAAMRRYTPTNPERERTVRVLLSIAVSATSEVDGVRAVQPVLPPGVHAIAMHADEAGDIVAGAAPLTIDPQIVAAAEAIGRTLRFRPAERWRASCFPRPPHEYRFRAVQMICVGTRGRPMTHNRPS